MNILPLVLVLLLMLSVITVEKFEKVKSLIIVQHHYQKYLSETERKAFNDRQTKLAKKNQPSQRQLIFTYFYDKKFREAHPEQSKEIRFLTVELMKILYGHTSFYKTMENKRSNFIDELLDEFIAAADALNENEKVKRIEDIQRVRLADPELQEAFYHMLKGTISKKELKLLKKDRPLTPRNEEKVYLPLLDFLKHQREKPKIMVHLASRELLTAIFGKDDIVEAIIQKRSELDPKNNDASTQFANEFKGKQKSGISDALLDFKITATDKSGYD
ncbi:MAG: hypothetical protein H0V82_05670 [Candidatus Protochlamydia sp.]|nr:hypothetical protein [Candidatus Protochlamydia sp.]